jgi:pimeloyl-ACP methyl ester carboxylesterase
MPHLDRDGVKIHYRVAGSGPAVLLTHGYSASSRMFDANVDALAHDHTVVTWDIRGHGDSDYPSDPDLYSVPLSVADMAALLDVVGAERAVIGGHSLGGFLSLEFDLAHHERVAGLLLIGTGPGYRKDEARDAWNGLCERFARRFEERGLDAIGRSEELRADLHRDASGLVLAARGILAQRDARVIDSLPHITVPTLVVLGANDEPYVGSSTYMAHKIPGATLVEIPDAGHAPNVSQPGIFNREVRAFLERVPA